MKLRVHVTPDGLKTALWPGTFVLSDSEGRDLHQLRVRAGDTEVALVPLR